ncbi:MAG TPA: HAMP domain-containing sensor histidine kinase [Candidatus Saccharimonadia bacterium]
MLIDYYPEAVKNPATHELIDDIHESSERLIAIVNDFLDASRLEQNRFVYNLQEVALAEVAEKVIYEMSSTAKAKNIKLELGEGFHYDGLPHLVADPGRIKQILYNLIGNAVKFTDQGGVTLDAKLDGDRVAITVTDTGRGISLESQALLFHKFQQATDSILTRDNTKGTGLGLYISRLLAEGMGGSLNLKQSTTGQGSTFIVQLPVATPGRLKALAAAKAKVTDSNTGLTTGTRPTAGAQAEPANTTITAR